MGKWPDNIALALTVLHYKHCKHCLMGETTTTTTKQIVFVQLRAERSRSRAMLTISSCNSSKQQKGTAHYVRTHFIYFHRNFFLRTLFRNSFADDRDCIRSLRYDRCTKNVRIQSNDFIFLNCSKKWRQKKNNIKFQLSTIILHKFVASSTLKFDGVAEQQPNSNKLLCQFPFRFATSHSTW